MHKSMLIMIPGIFISGFMLGLYITLLYQNRLQTLGQNGTIIPIIGGIAGGVSILKFIYDWKQELALQFSGTVSRDIHYYQRGHLVTKLYCLKVKKNGVGGAEACEGQIKVEGKDVDYYATQWYNEVFPVISITMYEQFLKLEIIELNNEKKIRFYSVRHMGGIDIIDIPYNDDNINKRISARIGSTNAKVPRSPFSKNIYEIINDP